MWYVHLHSMITCISTCFFGNGNSSILTITLLLGTKGHSKDNSNPLELDEDDLERVSPCYKDTISCFHYWQ